MALSKRKVNMLRQWFGEVIVHARNTTHARTPNSPEILTVRMRTSDLERSYPDWPEISDAAIEEIRKKKP